MAKNNIKFTRGDTYSITFQRKDANGNVIPVKSEKMWLTVKKNYKTETILIEKTLADGTIQYDEDGFYHVTFEPQDTRNLKYKKYVFDIEVENMGVVSTIYKGIIELTNEVTFKGGVNS